MVPFLCFSPVYFFPSFFKKKKNNFFFYSFINFFFPLKIFFPPVQMCRQLVEKARDAGEMLVRCGMRLPLGDPSQAGSE